MANVASTNAFRPNGAGRVFNGREKRARYKINKNKSYEQNKS